MRLNIFTIVLNGMPYIERHLEILQALRIPWRWSIIDGAAANVKCTKWCKPQPPTNSTDGTLEYVRKICRSDKRVQYLARKWWDGGKLQMCNAALDLFREPGILLQMDVDEFYTAEQLERITQLFQINQKAEMAYFKCRYFFGPDIIVDPKTDPNNRWLRAWWFNTGLQFTSHEPPILCGNQGPSISEHDTERVGIVFDHFAYATEAQVMYKERFYGYKGALNGWRGLQSNKRWPTRAKDWMPWCHDGVMLIKI